MSEDQETQELAQQFQEAVGDPFTHVVIPAETGEAGQVNLLVLGLDAALIRELLQLLQKVAELAQSPGFETLAQVEFYIDQGAYWSHDFEELQTKVNQQGQVFITAAQEDQLEADRTSGITLRVSKDHVWWHGYEKYGYTAVSSDCLTLENLTKILEKCP